MIFGFSNCVVRQEASLGIKLAYYANSSYSDLNSFALRISGFSLASLSTLKEPDF